MGKGRLDLTVTCLLHMSITELHKLLELIVSSKINSEKV